MTTHTHVGYRSRVGYVHCGSRLWGHRIQKAGRRHALNGGPDHFTSLCGETVSLRLKDDFGDEVTPNVREVADPESRTVTCKRCLRLIAKAPKPVANHWTVESACGDVDARTCAHGVPLNVFCGRCEG